MDSYFAFERAVGKDAWQRTWNAVGPKREHWLLDSSIVAAGAAISWLLRGRDAALEEIGKALIDGALALGAVVILLLAWNLITAPFRLWRADRLTIERLTGSFSRKLHDERNIRNLRRCIVVGRALLEGKSGRWATPTQVQRWYELSKTAVRRTDSGEAHMFETICSCPSGAIMDYDRAKFEALIGRLRNTMNREIQKARGGSIWTAQPGVTES